MKEKLCVNGHVMAPSWTQCRYCPRRVPKTKVAVPVSKPTPKSKQTVFMGSQADAPLHGWLVPLDGLNKGHSFELRTGRLVIGSGEDCDLRLSDEGISERHAELFTFPEKQEWYVEDLRSLNGTFLNSDEDRIEQKETVVDNDLIRLASIRLIFKALPHNLFS